MLKTMVSSLAVMALALGLSTPTHAAFSDHTTKFTFSRPIALPGITLPAGTYTFRVADATERKTIQVLDAEGMHYTWIPAISTTRTDGTDDPKVELMATVNGMPAAIQAFYPLGERTGFEFIYPHEQYAKLTGAINEPSIVRGEGSAAFESKPPVLELAQSNTQSAPAVAQTPADASSSVAKNPTRDALPQTATPLPLIALVGALTLFGGAWMLNRSNA